MARRASARSCREGPRVDDRVLPVVQRDVLRSSRHRCRGPHRQWGQQSGAHSWPRFRYRGGQEVALGGHNFQRDAHGSRKPTLEGAPRADAPSGSPHAPRRSIICASAAASPAQWSQDGRRRDRRCRVPGRAGPTYRPRLASAVGREPGGDRGRLGDGTGLESEHGDHPAAKGQPRSSKRSRVQPQRLYFLAIGPPPVVPPQEDSPRPVCADVARTSSSRQP